MDILTQHDLGNLIKTYGEWHVSIYMPAVRAGAETQQNTIRFKNCVRKAEDQLEKLGERTPDIDRLLDPATALLEDPDFWRHSGDGLAVFVSPDDLYFFRLPLRFEELVVTKHRFYIKPLLPLMSGDGQFYVLALSQDEVRLLEGSRDSVNEIELEGIPDSLAEALQYDSPQKQVRAVGTGGAGGGEGAVFHGHGLGTDTVAKQNLQRYFQMVDRGLREFLAGKRIPLVLAGVDYLLPIYREANSYGHLLEEGLTGNPEMLSAKELHQRAWNIVRPYFAQAQSDQTALYRQLAGRSDDRASDVLKTIVQAAYEGRVATLFVPLGVRTWGIFDPEDYTLHVHLEKQPGDQDLLDLAAIHTFANSGVVYAVEPDAMPVDTLLAAVFRY